MTNYHMTSFQTTDGVNVSYCYTRQAVTDMRKDKIPDEDDLFVRSAMINSSVQLEENDFEVEAIEDFKAKIKEGVLK